MKKKLCCLQELRFYCRIAEDLSVLECYAVSTGKQLPMSWTNVCVYLSSQKPFFPLL